MTELLPEGDLVEVCVWLWWLYVVMWLLCSCVIIESSFIFFLFFFLGKRDKTM